MATPEPALPAAVDRPVHTLPASAVYAALSTQPAGLSQAQVDERRQVFGANAIKELPRTPHIVRFLSNFTHLMAILLWAGGAIGFAAQLPQLGIAIWMVNLINGSFSFWQEYKAEKATEALRRLIPFHARVRRDGCEQQISASELVPGDIMILAEGDRICADARLVRAHELRVDQSTLTGESLPAAKSADEIIHSNLNPPELRNLVFAGTAVMSGSGEAVVTATGMRSEFGKIALLTESTPDRPSPLQMEMARVTRIVTALAVGIGLVFFLLATFVAGVQLAESFVFAMGMIVAFVPEGMLPTVTLSLAMGVQRMAGRNALVKRLSAVETLGCTGVICTDKTGTLTKNEMTVRELWSAGRRLLAGGSGYAPLGTITLQSESQSEPIACDSDVDLEQLLVACALCNNARLLAPGDDDNAQWRVLGDPTEGALIVLCKKGKLDLDVVTRRSPRLKEIPFDSRRKRMSTIHRTQHGVTVYVKGAPRELLALCTSVACNGKPQPLSESDVREILSVNDEYARSGLRVLAVAMRTIAAQPNELTAENVERNLTLLGLVAMLDPPHPEVAEAVRKCHNAGIKMVMITGDYGLTAESIARRIGMIGSHNARIITGAELDDMSEEALTGSLAGDVIFARATPEHKLRVVGAYQNAGYVVAVTGDGVNDAPSLKRADIGVAMGVSGTDVAKESADMILLDDNFASIVNAIEEGRTVYANIRRFAIYVFNSNMAEAVPFVLMLFSRGAVPLPLTIMQVLSIDLGTDMVPALALGAEPPESGVMRRPPRSLAEPLLSWQVFARALLWYGLIESFAAISGYFFLNWLHGWPVLPLAAEGTPVYRMATTMTLAGVVVTQVGAVFGCRSDRTSLLQLGFFTNKLVIWGIACELILLLLIVYVPVLQGIFNTGALGLREWAFAFAWTPIIIVLDELRKLTLRITDQKKARGFRQCTL